MWGLNPEHCCNTGKFLTMEKPVGFLNLEMRVVFREENSVCTGFAQLEKDREVDLNNQKKKKKSTLSHSA